MRWEGSIGRVVLCVASLASAGVGAQDSDWYSSNGLATNQYFSGQGGLLQGGCPVRTCSNEPSLGWYYSRNGGNASSGCVISRCDAKPDNSEYISGVVNLVSGCPYGCNAGYFRNATGGCVECPVGTFSGSVNSPNCSKCIAGVDMAPLNAEPDVAATVPRVECKWMCKTGYDKDSVRMLCVLSGDPGGPVTTVAGTTTGAAATTTTVAPMTGTAATTTTVAPMTGAAATTTTVAPTTVAAATTTTVAPTTGAAATTTTVATTTSVSTTADATVPATTTLETTSGAMTTSTTADVMTTSGAMTTSTTTAVMITSGVLTTSTGVMTTTEIEPSTSSATPTAVPTVALTPPRTTSVGMYTATSSLAARLTSTGSVPPSTTASPIAQRTPVIFFDLNVYDFGSSVVAVDTLLLKYKAIVSAALGVVEIRVSAALSVSGAGLRMSMVRRRRRALLAIANGETIVVTVVVGGWGEADGLMQAARSSEFQRKMTVACQANGLPEALVVVGTVGYANVAPPVGTAAEWRETPAPTIQVTMRSGCARSRAGAGAGFGVLAILMSFYVSMKQ